jgi:hypothetical protein
MKHTASDVYAAAVGAGLPSAAAALATAVALAESISTGLDDTALGDRALENNTWGPSVGVWQIRTLKAETGSGHDRDISALTGNLRRQAQAMANISSHGTNFTAWSTFNTGAYHKYVNQGNAAAVGGLATLPTAATVQTGLTSDVLNQAIEPAKNVAIKLMFGAVGLALAGAGVLVLVSPGFKKSVTELKREAGNAKDVAMVVK